MMCGQNQENKKNEIVIGHLSSSSFALPSAKEGRSSEIAMTSPQNGKKRARSPPPTKGRSAAAARPPAVRREDPRRRCTDTRAQKADGRTDGLRGRCPKIEAATARRKEDSTDRRTAAASLDRLQLRNGRRKGNNNAAARFAASPIARILILVDLEGLFGFVKGPKAM